MIKFKTFIANYSESAAERLTHWLAENSWVELISWQASPVGTKAEVAITIQYREWEE